MSYLSDLTTARDGIASEIATISANPRMTYSVDGRTFSHDQHLANLVAQLEPLNKLVIQAGGPGSQTTETVLLG